jgi:hypothetical protein
MGSRSVSELRTRCGKENLFQMTGFLGTIKGML